METNCECQYTVTLTDQVLHRQLSETKDNFTHVPSIHEVDEEETDEEYTYEQESTTPKDVQQIANIIKETADDDSLYSNESFCSDVSCDESEGTNVTSRSFDGSHFSSQVIDRKCNKEDKIEEEERSKSTAQGSEAANSVRCESSISEDKLTSLQQIKNRRKNMTFTDEELRKIEWENQLLLRKIMAQQKPKEKIPRDGTPQGRVSSSAINRKKLQRKIESENILLLQRIQQTKSRVANTMTKSGCRQTFL